MDEKPRVTPKDFFLWLSAMAALYASAIALLTLLFQYINRLFPDELDLYVDPFSPAIRFSIATLIVVFPVYILLTRMLNQDIRRNPAKKDLWVRRWLIFITLFVAGITIAGDLIALINAFLGGELTTRFVLKVAAILVVVGTGFGYYLYDLRGYWREHEQQSKMIAWITAVALAVSIVGGFLIIGSPQSQREIRFDQERAGDLQTIQWQIVNYWQQKEALPAMLEDLEDPISGFQVPTDPQTREAYEYTIMGPLSFELCATFNRASIEKSTYPRAIPALPESVVKPTDSGDSWSHNAGHECFSRTIDPELYPPRSR